jgi:hypothetical protein
VRIRQIALVARALEPVVDDLRAILGLDEPFADPGVAEFGLKNAVLALGDQFLEVVCPVRADATAQRYLERRGGDGGYMVILQSDHLDADRTRLARAGVRIVWEIALPDIATIHLHPRDIGGAIVSLDRPLPPEAWRWAGPGWQERGARSDVLGIAGLELQSDDPAALARRWAEALGCALREDARGVPVVELAGGHVRFVAPGDDRGPGIACVRLLAHDPGAIHERARARGALDTRGRVQIGGVRFDLVAASVSRRRDIA